MQIRKRSKKEDREKIRKRNGLRKILMIKEGRKKKQIKRGMWMSKIDQRKRKIGKENGQTEIGKRDMRVKEIGKF